MRPRSFFAGILLLFVLGCGVCQADGIFSKTERYSRVPPAIPSQRALIVFRDGTERLVVQSKVEAEGPELAWIVPVPATPTALEVGSAGILKELSQKLNPIVRGVELDRARLMAARCAVFFTGVWAISLFLLRPRWKGTLLLLGACFVGYVFVVLLFGAYGGGSETSTDAAGAAEAVNVEHAGIVGNYDVAVLEAREAPALNQWLSENGFAALPERADPIVAAYIKEGWHFVAAKLRTEGGGVLQPHPLEIAFPVEQPVYPMRLTALADSDVYVELFVASDRSARSDRLALQVTDSLRLSKSNGEGSVRPAHYGSLRHYQTGFPMQHPAVADYLWDGCILTRLDGTITRDRMDADVALDLVAPAPFQAVYFTPEAAKARIGILAMYIGSFIMLLGGLLASLPRKESSRFLTTATSAAMALAVGVWSVSWLKAPPIVEAQLRDESEAHSVEPEPYLLVAPAYAAQAVAEAYEGFSSLPREEMANVLRAHFMYFPVFGPDGRPVAPGDTTFTVDTLADGVALTIYPPYGLPQPTRIPDPSTAPIGSVEELRGLLDGSDFRVLWARAFEVEVYSPKRAALLRDPQLAPFLIELLSEPFRQGEWGLIRDRLASLTGLNMQEPVVDLPGYWRAWWQDHKDETRLQWLQEEWNHPRPYPSNDLRLELALLGDPAALADTATSLKRDSLSGEAVVAAAVLCLAGWDQGYAWFTNHGYDLGSNGLDPDLQYRLATQGGPPSLRLLLRLWDRNPRLLDGWTNTVPVHAAYAIARDLHLLATPALEVLERAQMGENVPLPVIEFCAGSVGMAAKVIPPSDLRDTQALGLFLESVRARLSDKDWVW